MPGRGVDECNLGVKSQSLDRTPLKYLGKVIAGAKYEADGRDVLLLREALALKGFQLRRLDDCQPLEIRKNKLD